MPEEKKIVMTTDAGRPIGDNQNSLTVGPRGPVVFEDFLLFEKMAHFNRERIPERVVHAKGSGAYGHFVCTNAEIAKYTTAKLFNAVGKKTPTFIRFSTVGGEKGSADTARDPRGFALKFYTEEGNWDMTGNNTPVFFIRDPLKFGDFIHTQKRDPETNLKSPTMMWDFWSLSPESLHQVTILFSDRGTPDGYRHMNGYSSHTFSLINAQNELFYVKWHFKTKQGIKNFFREQAGSGLFATRSLQRDQAGQLPEVAGVRADHAGERRGGVPHQSFRLDEGVAPQRLPSARDWRTGTEPQSRKLFCGSRAGRVRTAQHRARHGFFAGQNVASTPDFLS